MINPVYRIEIDDLTIRCYEFEDAPKIKEAIDCSIEHLHKYMIWSHSEPETIEQKKARIKRWRTAFMENIDYTYGIFRGEKQLGSTGLHTSLGMNSLEIGYWVRADEIRKGIATKASLALAIVALEYVKISNVEIRHHINNTTSSKIPQKLNFKKLDNYFEDNIENGRWLMTKAFLDKNRERLKKFYTSLKFYDIDGNELLR